MIERLAQDLVGLQRELARTYSGTSNMQEVVPREPDGPIPVRGPHLESLHTFASENPIYYNSYEQTVGGTACVVYEGDINRFWLGSIQNGQSCAPFSPTWICSAYAAVLEARSLGAREIVDIGSGDGRIAYCAKLLGLDSYSIELDRTLADLQRSIADSTGTDFHPVCADATRLDYSSMGLSAPAFFIGGLAQMGGDRLAGAVLGGLHTCNDAYAVLAGTYSEKYAPDALSLAGWGTTMQKHGLRPLCVVSLPTVWTFREPDATPYVFAGLDRNPN